MSNVSPFVPWIVIGDYNEILSNNDKHGGAIRSETQMDAFHSTMDHCHLLPLPYYIGDLFTWRKNIQNGSWMNEILDWAIINNYWDFVFSPTTDQHLEFYKSDHRAIRVQIMLQQATPTQPQRKSCFYCESIWLEEKESYDIIKQN